MFGLKLLPKFAGIASGRVAKTKRYASNFMVLVSIYNSRNCSQFS